MTKPMSDADKAQRQLLAAIKKIRRNTSGDPMYHSGRKKKEYASPYLEFLDKMEKAARKNAPALRVRLPARRWNSLYGLGGR